MALSFPSSFVALEAFEDRYRVRKCGAMLRRLWIIHICIHKYMCVCVYDISMHIYVYARVYVYIYVCKYVRMHARICMYTCT